MVIITSFTVSLNTFTGNFTVDSDDPVASECPFCGTALVYRDRRLRGLKNLAGEKSFYSLRRLLCRACPRLHTEIPDIIQPFKHYDSATIQCVIDDDEGGSACVAEDSTIRRWKDTFAKSESDIAQRLASVHARMTDEIAPIHLPAMVFAAIRAKVERWLAFVMTLLINSGHRICTRFAFCPGPSSDRVVPISKKTTSGGRENDKTIEDAR